MWDEGRTTLRRTQSPNIPKRIQTPLPIRKQRRQLWIRILRLDIESRLLRLLLLLNRFRLLLLLLLLGNGSIEQREIWFFRDEGHLLLLLLRLRLLGLRSRIRRERVIRSITGRLRHQCLLLLLHHLLLLLHLKPFLSLTFLFLEEHLLPHELFLLLLLHHLLLQEGLWA